MMNRALIGLSSPIGYNYKLKINEYYPNAILDAPLGLFLLFDEIWFVTKELCPLNMQQLPYVFFLNEEHNLDEIDIKQLIIDKSKIKLSEQLGLEAQSLFSKAINLNISNPIGIDNVGSSIKLSNEILIPSTYISNLVIDDFLANNYKLNLIMNSITSLYERSDEKETLESQVIHRVLSSNLVSFQFNKGPYHEVLDELRNETALKDFREMISKACSQKELEDLNNIAESIQIEANEFIYNVAEDYLKDSTISKGIYEIGLGNVPLVSNLLSTLSGGSKIIDAIGMKQKRWITFFAKTRKQIMKLK